MNNAILWRLIYFSKFSMEEMNGENTITSIIKPQTLSLWMEPQTINCTKFLELGTALAIRAGPLQLFKRKILFL